MKRAKFDCFPLWRKGDLFKLISKNYDPDLMPIEAMRLKDKFIYGFEEGELEEA